MVIDNERVRREKLTESLERLVDEDKSHSYNAAQRFLEEAERNDSFFLQNVEQAKHYLGMAEIHYVNGIGDRITNVIDAYQALMALKSKRDLPIDYEEERIEELKGKLPTTRRKFLQVVGYYLTLGFLRSKSTDDTKKASDILII